jgi:hypothetical protein
MTSMHQQLQLRRRVSQDERRGGATSPLRASPGRTSEHARAIGSDLFYYVSLEADSHRPEVQTIIRDAIRRGTIRVQPVPGCENRVKISQAEPAVTEAPAV